MTLRCILISLVFILAGVHDIKTWQIPDWIPLLLILIGCIDLQLLSALTGFILVPMPFFLAAITTGKIGGGDVKLMAAAGFCLGVTDGFRMMIYGLWAGILWSLMIRKGQGNLPLAPFLAIGGIAAMLTEGRW